MSVEKNKEIISRLFEIFKSHDLSALEEVCDESIVYGNNGEEELQGLDAYREMLREDFEAFPDLNPELQEMIGEGDRISSVHIARGTHEGDYDGITPTGRSLEVVVSDNFTLRGGKVIEHQEFHDFLAILRQLGAASDELRPGGKDWPRRGTHLRPQ